MVSFLFLLRAAVSEFAAKNVAVAQRDILWGLSAGAFLAMVQRLGG